ncbi:hypothetical protein KUCAC02_034869, partial [Chaenocephalus aceratus]
MALEYQLRSQTEETDREVATFRTTGFTSSQEVTDHEERCRVSECCRLQTSLSFGCPTVTRGAFDEMFNDAWVSAPLRPGPSACNEASPPRDPQARVWASSGGNGPLGAIHNPTRARPAALLCQ